MYTNYLIPLPVEPTIREQPYRTPAEAVAQLARWKEAETDAGEFAHAEAVAFIAYCERHWRQLLA